MSRFKSRSAFSLLLTASLCLNTALALELSGEFVQGGLVFGQTEEGQRVFLDEKEVMVSIDGNFVIGFGRDETGERTLRIRNPDGTDENLTMAIALRDYNIERVDGLPPRTVTPDPEAAKRIKEEGAMVANARNRRDERTDYAAGFAWPAQGRISGVYGSQRV